ncbi:MAG: carboxypeptidase regulatory-like domain-containing protein [Burkholderiales bacterium]
MTKPTLFINIHTRQLVLALSLSALAGSAFAQIPAATAAASASQQSMSAATAPEVKQQDGISYVAGGISDDGQAKAKELGKDMPLHLVFAKSGTGHYMADVAVMIADKGGKTVFDLKSSDPLLYVKLPAGSYKVTAKGEDKTLERTVEVPAKGQHTETLRW